MAGTLAVCAVVLGYATVVQGGGENQFAHLSLVRSLAAALVAATVLAAACGGAPAPAPEAATEQQPTTSRTRDVRDDCAVVPGEPAPEPLAKTYEGVAAKARCQREVYTIMGGLTHFLGVQAEWWFNSNSYR